MDADFNRGTRGNQKMNLTDKHKIFMLAHKDMLSNKEIGERLNVSEGKVRSWFTELGVQKKKGPLSNKMTYASDDELFVHDKKLATI